MEPHRALPILRSPSVDQQPIVPIGIFAGAIFVEVSENPVRKALEYAVSLVLHAAVCAALVILPLFLLGGPLESRVFTNAEAIVAVPPPLTHARLLDSSLLPVLKRSIPIPMPIFAPPLAHAAKHMAPPPVAPPPLAGNLAGVTGGIRDLAATAAADSPVLIAPGYSPDTQSNQVGGYVRQAHAIDAVSLPYPEAAKQFRITGKVILRALVDERGKVRYVRALSGPALLADAAARAISKEIFAPAILNGKATTCDLVVIVNFSLF
jgi:Gram-negative bacterial TonB protein C-terminal